MRKLLLPALVVVALIVACENKNPNGPGGVGPGGVIVSLTTTSTTTSTSTTTTTVPATTPAPGGGTTTTSVAGSVSRRFITLNAPPNVPSDMTLFFQLLTGGLAPLPSLAARLPFVGQAITTATEIRYKVTGVYVTTNNTTGSIEGDLFGPADPIQNGGEFHGVLTTTVSGCTVERVFRGPMGPTSMNLQGGEMVRTCATNPLSFEAVTMTQSNSPPPPATSTTSSTTSTTTTTSIAACSFTVAPLSASVPATASTTPITITLSPGSPASCTWTAQALASFLSVTPPTGAGSGSVQVTAAANSNGPSRVGSLLLAGQLVSIDQAAPIPPDLAPFPALNSDGGAEPCSFDVHGQTSLNIFTRNIGKGAATVPSFTNVFLTTGSQTMSDSVPSIDVGQQDLSVLLLPETCYVFDPTVGGEVCRFTVTVDATNAVLESAETNNVYTNACVRFDSEGLTGARVRTVRALIPGR